MQGIFSLSQPPYPANVVVKEVLGRRGMEMVD